MDVHMTHSHSFFNKEYKNMERPSHYTLKFKMQIKIQYDFNFVLKRMTIKECLKMQVYQHLHSAHLQLTGTQGALTLPYTLFFLFLLQTTNQKTLKTGMPPSRNPEDTQYHKACSWHHEWNLTQYFSASFLSYTSPSTSGLCSAQEWDSAKDSVFLEGPTPRKMNQRKPPEPCWEQQSLTADQADPSGPARTCQRSSVTHTPHASETQKVNLPPPTKAFHGCVPRMSLT